MQDLAMDRPPQMGFGTYGRTGPAGVQAILDALEAGYRHIDTAQTYDTEREVGEAFRLSGLKRGEVFITTKISTDNFGPGRVIPSLEASVKALGLVPDLTLIHWPSPNGRQPLSSYLPQLLEAQEKKLTRLVGVSNFTIALLDEALNMAGPGRIVNNQFELNPWLQNRRLADHCQARNVAVTCYLPIAKGRLGRDPVLVAIARDRGAAAEQVALAWEMARGYAAIPTSGQKAHIESNFAATRLRLSADELARIDGCDQGERMIRPSWAPDWDQK